MEINGATVCPSASVKLLGITIDAGLKFDQHVKTLCQKVNKSVTAFSRVAKLLDLDKAKLLYNSWGYFLIKKSVGWTFDTLELPTAQTLKPMAA